MKNEPRMIYFGTDEFSAQVLKKIQEHLPLQLIVTAPPAPSGRGLQVKESAVAALAKEIQQPFLAPVSLKEEDFLRQIKELKPDIFLVVSYGKIMPQALLQIAKEEAINVHPSLLPRWRGPSPIQSAILFGEPQTGVSIIRVIDEVDAGDILLQQVFPLDDEIHAGQLFEELANVGADLLIEGVKQIQEGVAKWREQSEKEVTHSQKITKYDGELEWHLSAREIHNKIRAFYPWPGTFSWLSGKRVKLLSSTLLPDKDPSNLSPGCIQEMSKEGPMIIQTGEGLVQINRIQLEGKRPMTPYEVSVGHELKAGTVFRKSS